MKIIKRDNIPSWVWGDLKATRVLIRTYPGIDVFTGTDMDKLVAMRVTDNPTAPILVIEHDPAIREAIFYQNDAGILRMIDELLKEEGWL